MNKVFPLFQQVRKGEIAFLPCDDHKFATESARMVTVPAAADKFALWSIDSVVESPPRITPQEFHDIPCLPPFRYIWSEWHEPGDAPTSSPMGVGVVYDDDVRACEIHTFLYVPNSRQPFHLGSYLIVSFSDSGTVLDPGPRLVTLDGIDPEFTGVSEDVLKRSYWMMMTAFMFAHCKNVSLQERLPSRQERRAAERKGVPILKYHEIVIDPHKTQQPSTGANRTDDKPHKALHIARGHFAHYTEDRPLFGKYVGTFWRPAHVRGSAEVGTVKSTYRVRA